jgi:hypothetical protein
MYTPAQALHMLVWKNTYNWKMHKHPMDIHMPAPVQTILVPVEMTFIDIVGFDGNDK